MKSFTSVAVAVTVFASAVFAQVPKCAQSCVGNALSGSGCGSNINCICSNMALISTLSCCVFKNCDAADGQTAVQFADNICKVGGVTNLPQSPSCPSSTGSSSVSKITPSGSGHISIVGPVTPTSINSAQSGILSSLSADLSSIMSSGSSMVSSAMSTPMSTPMSSSMSSSMSAPMSTMTAPAPVSTNAAAGFAAREIAGAVAAGAAGVAAVLL